jgi:hypothetical protein
VGDWRTSVTELGSAGGAWPCGTGEEVGGGWVRRRGEVVVDQTRRFERVGILGEEVAYVEQIDAQVFVPKSERKGAETQRGWASTTDTDGQGLGLRAQSTQSSRIHSRENALA